MDLPPWTHVFSGAIAGTAASFANCPLDVIKTRAQASSKLVVISNTGRLKLLPSLQAIVRSEGIRGLYRGLTPTMAGYAPSYALYFTLYQLGKRQLQQSSWMKSQSSHLIPMQHVLAASLAGACTNITMNPVWVLRARLMTQRSDTTNRPYRGTVDAARRIFKKEGIGAFYRGSIASLLGVVHVSIYFPLYEYLKVRFSKSQFLRPSVHDAGNAACSVKPSRFSFSKSGSESKGMSTPLKESIGSTTISVLLASSLSKMVATMATYPHEVIRTRMQLSLNHGHNASISQVIRSVIVSDGLAGLYRGVGINFVRAIPSAAVTFVTYELFISMFRSVYAPTVD